MATPPTTLGARLFSAWHESLADRRLRAVGARIGITGAAVQYLLTGRNVPALATAFRIEDVSGGAVPARAWTVPDVAHATATEAA